VEQIRHHAIEKASGQRTPKASGYFLYVASLSNNSRM